MKEYICKEVPTDNGGYLEPVGELIRCKNCKFWCKGDGLELTNDGEEFHHCWELVGMVKNSNEALVPWNHFCAWAERKEE